MSVKLEAFEAWTSKDGTSTGYSVVEGSDKQADALIAKCKESYRLAKDAGLINPGDLTVLFTQWGKVNVNPARVKGAAKAKTVHAVDAKSAFAK